MSIAVDTKAAHTYLSAAPFDQNRGALVRRVSAIERAIRNYDLPTLLALRLRRDESPLLAAITAEVANFRLKPAPTIPLPAAPDAAAQIRASASTKRAG